MWFFSMFLYGFFKLQDSGQFLLPGPEDQLWNHFIAWTVIVLVFKLVTIYVKIYNQCTVDYYILDREKNEQSVHRVIRDLKNPKDSDMKQEYRRQDDVEDELLLLNQENDYQAANSLKMKSTVGWRSLFVSNQMNELQMY